MLGIAKDRNRASDGLTFYWQHYGLKKDPFSSLSEPSMFVNLPKFEHHMDLLLYLIRNENALLAIIGEKGCGKSSFMMHLTSQIDDAMHMQHIAADSLMTPDKLLNVICKGFEIDYQPSANKEDNLDNIIAKIQYKDKTCLLTIDDGHFLPLESLQLLLHLIREQSETQMRLHIILLGDHNLQSKLSNLVKHDLLGNMIHAIELEPLTMDETKQYLRYRVNQASTTKNFPFSDTEVERIHFFSKGIPEQINIQAQQSLLNELERRKPMAKKTKWQHYQTQILGGGLIVAILVIIALLMTPSHTLKINHVATNSAEPTISFDDQQQNVEEPKSSENKDNSPQNLITPTNSVEEKNSAVITTATNDSKDFILNIVTQNKNDPVKNSTSDSTDSAQPEVLDSTPTVSAHQSNDFIIVDKNNSISLKIHDDESGEHVMVPTEKTVDASKPNEEQITLLKKPVAPLPIEKPNSHHKSSIAKSRDYTIQIIGLSDEKTVHEFIRLNHLENQAHYFQTKLGDKPFYLLVYGEYLTEKEALNARKNLPQALQQYHPWVRTLGDMSNRMKMVG